LNHGEWREIADLADLLEIDLWIEVIGMKSAVFAEALNPFAWKVPYHLISEFPDIVEIFIEDNTYFRTKLDNLTVPQVAIGEQYYPTTLDMAKAEIELVKKYAKEGRKVLYADHREAVDKAPWYTAMMAYHAGADVIEKHICLSRSELKPKSKDYISSLEPHEFKEFSKFMKKYDRHGKVRMLV
jgi:hypothetical protein